MMDTKEAIGILGEYISHKGDKWEVSMTQEDILEFNNIISLLQQGKKHKRIVEDIEQYIIDWRTVEENYCTNGKDIIDLIKWLKRKYFPPIKKTVTIDFESEDKDVVNSCINLLKRRLEEYSETIHINYKIKED